MNFSLNRKQLKIIFAHNVLSQSVLFLLQYPHFLLDGSFQGTSGSSTREFVILLQAWI